nr:1,4-dihydroxy 2-naphthoate octaprenyltransferase [Cyanidioschyzonaceae sp. 3]WDB00355.1 menaquinone biosynthesis protein [Cyanidiococcus yangmingshanensis]
MHMKALLLASRPKTLLVSLCCWSSVSSFAYSQGSISFHLSLWALLLCLLLQIWSNWVNDYLDFLNGIDHPLRQGPVRLTKMLTPSFMKMALMMLFFFIIALSCYFQSLLILLMVLGLVGIAWYYSACLGLAGEWLTFFACGPLATYLLSLIYHMPYLHSDLLLISMVNGSWSAAVLMANNIRDRISDTCSPKKSTCVWFGSKWAIMEYQIFMMICVWCLFYWFILRMSFACFILNLLFIPYALKLCTLSMRNSSSLLLPTLRFGFRYSILLALCAFIT